MTRSPIILLALVTATSGVAGFATGPGRIQWAHAGNSYNSAIFVDRAVLNEHGAARPFRTFHVNAQPQSGWRTAEHRATINCAAATVRYGDVRITRSDGRIDTPKSALDRSVAFPRHGVMHNLFAAICAGKLGPAIGDPQRWAANNVRPG